MRRWIRLVAATGLAGTAMLALSLPDRSAHASAATPGLKFSHEVVTDEQRDGFEPDIQVAPHDTLYTSVPNGSSTTLSWLWTSTDHGNSFHLVPGNVAATGRLVNCPQGGGDTEELVDPKGDLFFSDLQNLTNLTNSVSRDGGNTFTSTCAGADNTPVDRMWYAAQGSLGDPGFRIYEEYDAVDSSANIGNQLVLEASDNGITFYPVVNPSAVQGGCVGGGSVNCVAGSEGISGNIVVLPNGNVAIAHTSGNGNLAQVTVGHITGPAVQALQGTYTTSTLNGKLCPDYPVDAAHLGKTEVCGATNFVTIAEDSAGNVYAAFASQQSRIENFQGNPTLVPYGPYEVYVTSSKDGLHWSDPKMVSSSGSNAFAWITAGAPGRVAVAWYSANETSEKPVSQGFSQDLLNQQLASPDPHGYLFDELNKAEFNIDVTVSTDALAASPTYAPPTTASEHPVKFGPICTQGTLCEVTQGDRSLGDFMEVNHDARGALILSYVDDTSGYYVTGPTGAVGDNGPNVVVREISGPNLLGGAAITGAAGGPGLAMGSVSDPTGDDFYSANGKLTPAGDNLDLTGASLSRDATGLVATMKLKSLSSLQVNPLAGGTTGEWITRFTTSDPGHAGNGHIYYAGMESVAGGTPRFFAGEPTRTKDLTAFNSTRSVPGSYDAKTGTITIHIPFAVIGNHSAPGTTFYSATAFTATTLGSLGGQGQATPPVEIFNQVDATTPFDFVLPAYTAAASQRNASITAAPAASDGTAPPSVAGASAESLGGTAQASGDPAASSGSHALSFTGFDAALAGFAGLLLIGSGIGVVVLSRRHGWDLLRLARRNT